MRRVSQFLKVPLSSLYVSEPDPRMFGNEVNPHVLPSTWSNANWLKSKFHFSFAEWNSDIANFGVLRVVNDDLVQPSRGFGTHPHGSMEIATVILQGELTHQDSMGSKQTLGRGSVQYMSAGTGIKHSERNNNDKLPLRFLQMWIMPKTRGGKPMYGGFDGIAHAEQQRNKWFHVATSVDNSWASKDVPIRFGQDVNIYLAECEPGTHLEFKVSPDRQAYCLFPEGETQVVADGKTTEFSAGDAAEAFGPLDLIIKANSPTFWVIVEMKLEGKSRFDVS